MATTPVLYCNLRERDGEIYGSVKHCANSTAVIDALAVLVEEFSKACEVEPQEICDDIKRIIAMRHENGDY